jgi:hypothetical protein
MAARPGVALIRIGDRQLCTECATETDWRDVDGPDDVITDQEMERRACLVFCDQCGKVINR